MSATRLLVLGAIRIMQPVHGYDVRRELLTWRLEELANVKPGSIYSAIRTLEKDGCLAVYAQESNERRPERTTYVLTGEGEKEFQLLLRQSWWTVVAPTFPLIPAMCLMKSLPREELIAALQARITALEAQIAAAAFTRATIADGATGENGEIPEHVREIFDYVTGCVRAEIDWARGFQKRLRSGAYAFAGEPGMPGLGPGIGFRAARDGAQVNQT
jgi:DNA-binding PadR family transcriptional regulator